MNHELIFSLAGVLSMAGWLALALSPFSPRWSDRVAGSILPALLAIGYVGIAVSSAPESGGFGTFAEVQLLFSNPVALLAGWVHFLAFDLFVGAWACRTARAEGMPFWQVLPCLPVIFLLGPAGFLLFMLVRQVHEARTNTPQEAWPT